MLNKIKISKVMILISLFFLFFVGFSLINKEETNAALQFHCSGYEGNLVIADTYEECMNLTDGMGQWTPYPNIPSDTIPPTAEISPLPGESYIKAKELTITVVDETRITNTSFCEYNFYLIEGEEETKIFSENETCLFIVMVGSNLKIVSTKIDTSNLNGKYKVKVKVGDAAKNYATIEEIYEFDNTDPIISGVEDKQGYKGKVEVSIADNVELYKVYLNGEEKVELLTGENFVIDVVGAYNLKAIDKAGNEKEINFAILKEDLKFKKYDEETAPLKVIDFNKTMFAKAQINEEILKIVIDSEIDLKKISKLVVFISNDNFTTLYEVTTLAGEINFPNNELNLVVNVENIEDYFLNIDGDYYVLVGYNEAEEAPAKTDKRVFIIYGVSVLVAIVIITQVLIIKKRKDKEIY